MKQFSTRSFSLFLRTGLFLALWLGTVTISLAQDACSLIPLSLDERMQTSELVVEGKVTSRKSYWDNQHQNIYTVNQVEVYKVFKGETSPSTVEVITEGGRVGMDLHVYSATLQLQSAQQGVFFLQAGREKTVVPRYKVFGSLQGFIRYQLPEQTARDPFQQYSSIQQQLYPQLTRLSGRTYRTLRTNPALETPKPATSTSQNQKRLIPLITRISPTSLRAGTGDVLTITGINFGATRGSGYVEFRNADDGGKTYIKPLDTDYISWSDTEIKVEVPTYGIDGGTAGSGKIRVVNADPNTATSLDSLTIVFAHSNVGYDDDERNLPLRSYGAEHIDQNGQGGYTFQLGASFSTNQAAVSSFKRAMNSWSCSTFINWNVGASASVTRTADDDINSVRFANAGELPSNVLGRCVSRYSGCITNNSEVNFWVTEMDLEFAPRTDWQYGPNAPSSQQYDFESVTVHELGHGHQLSHLILPRAIMHYAVGRGQSSRNLNPVNDIAGGNYVMSLNLTPNTCGPEQMVPKEANACAMLATLISFRASYQPNQTVLVEWNVAILAEDNSFEVERSQDGATYEVIGRVPVSSTGAQSFTFTDQDPLEGISYYRIRLVKNNNTTQLSEAVRVISTQLVENAPTLLPNPGSSQPRLLFIAQQATPLTLSFYDTSGRLYLTQTVQVYEGENLLQLVIPQLGRGLYLVRWQDNSNSGTLRYVKLD